MGLFDEKHTVDTRTIVFKKFRKLPDDVSQKLKSCLLELAKTPICQKFPLIIFEIENNGKGRHGHIDFAILKKGFPVVFLNATEMSGFIGDNNKVRISEIVYHELFHIKQHEMNQYLENSARAMRIINQNLHSRIDEVMKNPSRFDKRVVSVFLLRALFFDFSKKLYVEGSARFIGKFASDQIVFSQKEVLKSYDDAAMKSKELNNLLETILVNLKNNVKVDDTRDFVNRELPVGLKGMAYDLGSHMAYFIILNKIPFERVAKLGQYEFIREYELACRKFNLKPVISMGNNGILSIPWKIKQLTALYNQLKK